MDNIQKLIVGVLGIAGMIAMLVPSPEHMNVGGQTLLPPDAATSGQPSTQGPILGTQETSAETQDTEFSDEDVFSVTGPTIDGNPVQGEFGSPVEAPPAINYELPNMQVPNMPTPNYGAGNVPIYNPGSYSPYGQPPAQVSEAR